MRGLAIATVVAFGCAAQGCRVVDAIAPRQMTLTFEPNSVLMNGTRGTMLVGGIPVTTVRCDFDATIQAHGGSPSDVLALSYVESTWYDASGNAANQTVDAPQDWFGSNQLKYGERSVAHRYAYAYGAFSLRVAMEYIGPDLAKRIETFSLVCQ